MKARLQILAIICLMTHSALGDSPPRGKERLRELAVFPVMGLSIYYEYKTAWDDMWIGGSQEMVAEIQEIREALKKEPGDIDQMLHLAYLFGRNNQPNEERDDNKEVERLCRKKLDTTPENGWLLVRLGRALDSLEQHAEAESVLRKSILVSSNDWRCLAYLGDFLEADSFAWLRPPEGGAQNGMQQNQNEGILDYKPSSEARARSEELHREAARYMDRAVALGPKDPELWLARARFSGQSGQRDYLYRHQQDPAHTNSAGAFLASQFKDSISDLRKASQLKPKDFKLIYLPTHLEWLRSMSEMQAAGKTNLEASEMITDAAKKLAREALTQLENLYPQLNKTSEAGAVEVHGMLRLIMSGEGIKDGNGAALADFRRAVALDPGREQSWDMLLGLSSMSASPGEMEELCAARLKANDSARNHLIFARQLIREKKWDRAREHAESAVKLEPGNLIGKIMLAAFIIRQSKDNEGLEPATTQLEAVSKLIAQMADSQERTDRYREVMLNAALVSALGNYPQPDAEARAELDEILRKNPNDEDAKNIRAALE